MSSMGVLAGAFLIFVSMTSGEALSPLRTSHAVCPADFTNLGTTCLMLAKLKATWAEAASACSSVGAFLAIVDSPQKNEQVVWYLNKKLKGKNREKKSVWIGLHDLVKEGRFQWLYSSWDNLWTNWISGEPNNLSNEDCVHLSYKYGWKWNDMPCFTKEYFLCETFPR